MGLLEPPTWNLWIPSGRPFPNANDTKMTWGSTAYRQGNSRERRS